MNVAATIQREPMNSLTKEVFSLESFLLGQEAYQVVTEWQVEDS